MPTSSLIPPTLIPTPPSPAATAPSSADLSEREPPTSPALGLRRLFGRRGSESLLLWHIGSHEARIGNLENNLGALRHDMKDMRSELESVQEHLAHQDGDISDIKAGIADLRTAGQRRADEHRSTIHAIRIAAISTVLSSMMGLAIYALEHALLH